MNLEQMMLLGNLYKMYKGKDYEFSTLKNNEIFLSYVLQKTSQKTIWLCGRITRIIITDFVANMFLAILATYALSREEIKNYTTCCLTWVKLDIEIRLYQLIAKNF